MQCLVWGKLAGHKSLLFGFLFVPFAVGGELMLICRFLSDSDKALQEQAFNCLHNLVENKDSINMVFYKLGAKMLMTHLETTLESLEDSVVSQVSLPFLLPLPHIP
jgi:hypothetical protein